MSPTKINSIFQSFIVIPMIATSLSLSAFTAGIDQFVAAKADDQALSKEEQILQMEREEKAAKIDAYFKKHDLPLAGYGMTMVLAGEKYDVDPYLLASINMKESTGCKYHIKGTYNCSGWAGGKTKFKSYEEGIYILAMNLGGENPKTAHYYEGKSLEGILKTYNSVIPTYSKEIVSIMKRIEEMPV